jgi:exonuclease III
MEHVIGTYNMSFMSDLSTPIGPGMQFASEGAFLARLYGKPTERHSYWKNAMRLLKKFLDEEKPSVVGLQEMNVPDDKNSDSGTNAINTMLGDTPYKQISRKVETNNAGLSIIYNPEKIGEVAEDKFIKCIDNPNQGGRPLLMVITEKDGKNYLSISIHGAQDPKLREYKDEFNQYMLKNNKDFVQSAANTFLKGNGIDTLTGIFIMGDFNDRYDAINDKNGITIAGKTATYKGDAPKSCCYNWDSSCTDNDVQIDFGSGYKTCNVPAVQTNANGKLTLGERGAIKNYKYAGDKVFGLNPKTPLAMYRPQGFGENGISTESDHEFVYATFGEEEKSQTTTGGKRRTNRKTRRTQRKTKKTKQRKTKRRH